jgi:hypothetical protein
MNLLEISQKHSFILSKKSITSTINIVYQEEGVNENITIVSF